MNVILNSSESSNTRNDNGSHSLRDRIDAVIASRQSLAPRVKKVRDRLEAIQKSIVNLNQRYFSLKQSAGETKVDESLAPLELSQIQSSIQAELSRLEQLINRCSRSTLNIGVVGLMGQGKSTFLKSLSGLLSDNEIPAFRGGACTAVRSKIYHHDAPTKAVVKLYDENTFLDEVIAPYYDKLGLGPCPSTLDEFSSPLPELPKDIAYQTASHKTMHWHLKHDYHLTLRHYRSLIEGGDRIIELHEREEIPNYVVQRRDAQKYLTNYNHLAVREVEIYCKFDQHTVSNLGLIDVPGLGDTRLGDRDLILKTLGNDVDAVLFFNRPDPLRYEWKQDDVDLYDIAAEALPSLEHRAFMVLNHQEVEGNNWDACVALRKNLGAIKVVSCEIANCSDSDQTNQVLDIVLQHLEQHILSLEEQYSKFCQDGLMRLHKSINSILEKANQSFRASTQEHHLLRVLSKQLRQNLANGLRDLVEDLEKKQDAIDVEFQAVVQKALAACETDSGIPSPEEVKNRCRLDCHDSYKAAYCIYIAELRTHLSKNFLALDEGLHKAADQLKQQVVQVLVQSGLGGLDSARDVTFLDAITTLLDQYQSPLKLGFQTLSTFSVSYGELILNWIRRDLMNILDPDGIMQHRELGETAVKAVTAIGEIAAVVGIQVAAPVSAELVNNAVVAVDHLASQTIDTFFELNAETVHERLKILHRKAVTKCSETLMNWLNAPSKIRYGMLTEFVDRVLDAEDMQAEWDEFLGIPEVRNQVWLEEFGKIEHLKRVQQDWLEALQQVVNLNQPKELTFVNFKS